MGVLVRELAALYAAFAAATPSPLARAAVQYADYAAWQRQSAGRASVLERELAYWRRQLAGAPPRWSCPPTGRGPPVQTFRGAASAARTRRPS